MQSIEDEESLSQRFTYQKKVTGLLILTVTCTYPRSAVSFIFLTPLGDTFASKELILPKMSITSTEKKIYPKQRVKKAGIHFTKRVYKLSTSEREFLKKLICFISCHHHQSSRAETLIFTHLSSKECVSIFTSPKVQSI